MADFMKDREREWERAIKGDERRLREMDATQDKVGIKFILLYYLLPALLVGAFFIGIVKLWGWILG